MAGNIIPAIATTNAIIAGAIVLQALHLLRRAYSIPPRAAAQKLSLSPTKKPAQDPITKILRNVNIQTKPTVPLAATRVSPPNVNCSVCQDTYTIARCDVQSATLRELVEGAMGDGEVLPGVKKGGKGGTGLRDVSVFEGNRLLADPDFDDNMDKTLSEIGVERGSFVTLVDEDGDYGNLSLAIAALPYVVSPRHTTKDN
jgi:ubiquitin-like 1-activating enzyme E1 B